MKRAPLPNPFKVVTYSRCGISGMSEEDKKALAAEVIESKGWVIVADNSDRDCDCRDDDRPELKRAKNMLKSGNADVLFVAQHKDVAQSIFQLSLLLDEVQAVGYALYLADPYVIDTTTSEGNQIARALLAQAQAERQGRSDMSKEQIEEQRRRGSPVGRPMSATPEMIKQIRYFIKAPERSEIIPSISKIAKSVGLHPATCRLYYRRILEQEARLMSKGTAT